MDRQRVSRRDFLTAAATGAGTLAAASACRASERPVRRPNFVYIFSDQQHWQAMGSADPFFNTPHLDAFASDAAVFERAFCSTPQCSPSRSSMFTGLYPSKTGVMGNIGAAGGLPLRTESLGAMLQQAGYHTAYFGKWHLGDDPTGSGGWSEEYRKQKDPVTTEKAAAFLASPRAQQGPFAMVVSYLDPHDVYNFRRDPDPAAARDVVLPDSWHKETFRNKPPVQKQFMTDDQGTAIWGQPEEMWQWYREFYRRKVKLFDDAAGRVLDALRSAGLWENTIVVISSDHGDMDTNHRLIFKGPFMYEHMIRVPMMVRVPASLGGTLRGRIGDYDTVNVDLVPTVRDFAGLEPIPADGLSLKPILTGAADPPRREYVIGQYYSKQKWVNPIRTIRTSRYKLNKYAGDGQELYDMADDPHELVNLSDDPARRKIRGELSAELDHWIEANQDPFYSLKPVPLAAGRGKGKAAAGEKNR